MRLPSCFPSLLLVTALGLISCQADPGTTVVESTPTAAATTNPEPVRPTATPATIVPTGKHLTICMAEEPTTLYWHGRSTVFDEAVLHGIYENDLTTLSFSFQAVGLETVPSLAQGDAAFRVVPVDAGDKVVDAAGNVISLELGSQVINADGELETFNGSTLLMQQLVVDFLMRQRYWANGQPVTAADSIYSFHQAAHPESPADTFKIERTASYEATGNLSVRWAGLPGFRDENYQTNFHHPLPQHAWRELTFAELGTAEASSRLPMGDGPYRIIEWLPGEMIRLRPNPYYYRVNADLPRLDSVTFKFIPDRNQRISQLLAGECQIITHEQLDQELIPFFMEAQDAQLVNASIRPGPERWQISFGINSANDYGDGSGRPDWFEDTRVRQAVAMCINRQQIIDSVLSGYAFIPNSYLHAVHPFNAEEAIFWPFDRSAANALLDEVGLLDNDFDALREDTSSGADFRVSLITSHDQTERAVAAMLRDMLLECGIDVVIESLSDQLRFAEGAENRVNGRRYDLALTSASTSHIPNCAQFGSWEISGPDTEQNPATSLPYVGWDGQNHTGWSNPDFDNACLSANQAMPGTVDHALYHEQAQTIFSQNLPVLPLFFVPKTTATSPHISNIDNDPSQNSELWNLYAIDIINSDDREVATNNSNGGKSEANRGKQG